MVDVAPPVVVVACSAESVADPCTDISDTDWTLIIAPAMIALWIRIVAFWIPNEELRFSDVFRMRRFAPSGSLGQRFWLLVASATLVSIASSASMPLLPLYIHRELGGNVAASGAIISIGSLVGLASQPIIGPLADRWGFKPTVIVSIILGTIGTMLMLVVLGLPFVAVGRSLFAITGATVNAVCAAWVVASTERRDRGKALGLYGLNVWIGLALGPQVGQLAVAVGSFGALWITCSALLVLAIVALLPIAAPLTVYVAQPDRTARESFGEWLGVVRLVALPGLISTLIWSGEAVIMAYSIIHLEGRGLASSGIFAAATVFTVFGISVIVARLVLGRLPDRLGALRTTSACLVLLTAALLIIGFANSFLVASIAAVLMGFAFAPLYPALTLLASENLSPANRASGIGLFGAFTTLGMSAGALYGGILAAVAGTTSAFVAAAVAQVIAFAVVLLARRRAGRQEPQPDGVGA